MTLLDTREYIRTKEQVYADYENQKEWNEKVLMNIAKAGIFLLQTGRLNSTMKKSGI